MSDLSLLPVTADLVWLIELPGKSVQPVAIGSSLAMPENSLDPNGIMVSSAWETPTHVCCQQAACSTSSSGQDACCNNAETIGRGLVAVKPHWMTVGEPQNNPCHLPLVAHHVFLSLAQLDLSCRAPVLCTTTYGDACVPSRLVSAWTTRDHCQGMLTSLALRMMILGIKFWTSDSG